MIAVEGFFIYLSRSLLRPQINCRQDYQQQRQYMLMNDFHEYRLCLFPLLIRKQQNNQQKQKYRAGNKLRIYIDVCCRHYFGFNQPDMRLNRIKVPSKYLNYTKNGRRKSAVFCIIKYLFSFPRLIVKAVNHNFRVH